MPKHLWSVPCQMVLTDQETNAVSYIGAIEGFMIPETPFPFPPIFVGTVWMRQSDDDAVEMRLRVLSPSNDILFTKAHPRKVFEDFFRYRINIRFGGFDMTEGGMHHVLVEHREEGNWVEDTRLPIHVEVNNSPQEEESVQ